MVDLKAKPFYLDDEGVKWVKDTIANMSIEEKIGQLFFNMGSSRDEEYLKDVVNRYHIGGVRYNPASAEEVYEQNRILQENSKIPLIIACNVEAGGDGACTDGTHVGANVKIGATDDPEYAYKMGYVSAVEATSIGCNLSFAPVVDINQNWRNPVISRRCFSNNADKVLEHSLAYFKGAHESNFCCAAKHFPGDGLDERDQHVSNSVNTASCEEWDATYGKVYQGLIDEGLEAIMAGHIMQPAYTRYFHPEISDEDIMPATLSKELLTDLLRNKMGFNGMILTDASHMVGLTCCMKRSEVLPHAIAAGCDMFLFFNDMDEDFGYMMDGYKNGIITEERLEEALLRILALKARLGLHKKAPKEIMPPREGMSVIRCEEHLKIADEVAQKGITLVKNKQDIFPITPEKYKRIMIVSVKGLSAGGVGDLMHGTPKVSPAEKLKEALEKRGFEVEIFESPLDRIMKEAKDKDTKDLINVYFSGKTRIDEFRNKQDLIITLAEVTGGFQVVERVAWTMTKGGGEIPWYVNELPVVVASLGHPFLLADVPQAKTYINCYDSKDNTIEALASKLCGETQFTGIDPVDAYCGMWDTHR